MISAVILPSRQLDDQTVDQVIESALRSGLIACNKMQGPFRIAFFPKHRVPAGWARIGFADKTIPQEASCSVA